MGILFVVAKIDIYIYNFRMPYCYHIQKGSTSIEINSWGVVIDLNKDQPEAKKALRDLLRSESDFQISSNISLKTVEVKCDLSLNVEKKLNLLLPKQFRYYVKFELKGDKDFELYSLKSLIVQIKEDSSFLTELPFLNKPKYGDDVVPQKIWFFKFANEFEASKEYANLRKLQKTRTELGIEFVEPNYANFERKRYTKDDKREVLFPKSMAILNSEEYDLIDWDLREAVPDGNTEVKIGVLDSRVDTEHECFSQKTIKSVDCFGFGKKLKRAELGSHGTSCSSIVSGHKMNAIGERDFFGIFPGVNVVGIQIFKETENGNFKYDLVSIIKGLYTASYIEKVNVISCSWEFEHESEILTSFINNIVSGSKKLNKKGTPIVFAAGNNGRSVKFPANLKSVVTVGAVTKNGNFIDEAYALDNEMSWFSAVGKIDICAPGILISAKAGNGKSLYLFGKQTENYHTFFGTSCAAPLVAGAIGILLSKEENKEYNAQEVHSRLKETSFVPSNLKNWKKKYGPGIISVREFINYKN